MKIPFLSLNRQTELTTALRKALERVLSKGCFILGEEVEAFEREWAEYCGVAGSVGVNNGTDALKIALEATSVIKNKFSDEVITSPLTAPYTALAILNAGAITVFADVDPETYTLEPNSVEKSITPRTRAIVPVHLYGQMADMESINEIARKYDLVVIEDAAQAHGAGLTGKRAGNFGLAAAYSFYPTKNLGALGDGGAIVSNDQDFIEKVRLRRQGGSLDAMRQDFAGHNSRLDEIQAAFLRIKLEKLDEWTEKRRALARVYESNLADTNLKLPFNKSPESHVFHLYVVQHRERQKLRDFLHNRGIETMIHYPYLLHRQKLFRRSEQKSLPNAENAVNQILSLPLYPHLRSDEQTEIIAAIREFEG